MASRSKQQARLGRGTQVVSVLLPKQMSSSSVQQYTASKGYIWSRGRSEVSLSVARPTDMRKSEIRETGKWAAGEGCLLALIEYIGRERESNSSTD